MIRTCTRPLPSSRISLKTASGLTLGLYSASSAIFYFFFPAPALICANTIFYSYLLIYTPLKRKSELNTFIGSIVGGLPPLLGWLSAGGELALPGSLGIWAMVSYLIGWQFPHFYGILWMYKKDYQDGGYKMKDSISSAKKDMWLAYLVGMGLIGIGGLYTWS
jgi:protoheme IX farnesyltransferase